MTDSTHSAKLDLNANALTVLERRIPHHPFTEALRFELATQLVVPALVRLQPARATASVAS